MLLGLVFALLVTSCGWAILRLLGEHCRFRTLGLAPAAGVTVLAVAAAWAALLGAPLVLAAGPFLLLSGLGLVSLTRTAVGLVHWARDAQVAVAVLSLSIAVALLIQALAFGSVLAPLSPHDGAFHVHVVDTLRSGRGWQSGWYPPGLHAAFAALLQLVPWVDSVYGAFWLAMGLGLVLPLVIFGLGCAVWERPIVAAAGALFATLTYQVSDMVQLWSGWPFLVGTLLMLGAWTVAVEYLRNPTARRGLILGSFVAAILLVHGTEIYSTTLVLALTAMPVLRTLPWRRLTRDLAIAAGVAVVGAMPYLPMLVGWAGGGGASAVGVLDATVTQARDVVPLGQLVLDYGADALGLDLPVRIVLVSLGLVFAIRGSGGRLLILSAAMFAGIAAVFRLVSAPSVQYVYGLVFPWGQHYRLIAIAAIPTAMLAGRGAVALLTPIALLDPRSSRRLRLIRRTVTVLVPTWFILATWALVAYVSILTQALESMSEDDARAMSWLRAHATSGDVLANDGAADAGIWTPYKAGVSVVLPVVLADPSDAARRRLILSNVGNLAANPDAWAAACALRVRYVYSGAANSAWEHRHFPPLATLRQSPDLEEAFASGNAVVFKTRLRCVS